MAPWLITPNSASPNGYELDEGEASPCRETGGHGVGSLGTTSDDVDIAGPRAAGRDRACLPQVGCRRDHDDVRNLGRSERAHQRVLEEWRSR